MSDMAAAASLEHSREREGMYAPQLAAPGMYAGMRTFGTGHSPPGLGGGPLMAGMPGTNPIGTPGLGMGMNPGMMNMGMGGMNPMMVRLVLLSLLTNVR